MRFLCLHGAIGNIDVRETIPQNWDLLIAAEYQYPTRYLAELQCTETPLYKQPLDPLAKELETDQAASFHYINGPVHVHPPPGTKARLIYSAHILCV